MASGTATAVAKWGNSTGVRIPKSVAEQAGLHEGDQVRVEAEGPGVIVVRVINEPVTLESLVAQITKENAHDETDWGDPKGNEVW